MGGFVCQFCSNRKINIHGDSVGLQSTITNGVLTTDKMHLRLRKVSLIPLQTPLLIWYEVVWNQYIAILIPVATRREKHLAHNSRESLFLPPGAKVPLQVRS